MTIERLSASLADRYRIEREPRAGRPRPAVRRDGSSHLWRREVAPPSAPLRSSVR